MAKNITIAGASYTGVPAVNLQQTGGGTAKFVDTSGDTVTPETLLSGYTAHGADGEPIVGTLKPVLYTPQELTEEEKAQARENIGLITTEPIEDDIPKVFFGAALPQTKTDTIMPFRYISKTQDIQGYCITKAQGNSSMSYPKKNQTVKLYKDAECTEKLKIDFKGWGKQSKYCFKANWIDLTHSRNIVSARLWGDVVKNRSDYEALPELMRTSPNVGAINGFPIKVYADGIYQGRYTLNIPKDAWMGNMDDELDTHCILCGENYVSGCFRAEANIDGTDWTDEVHDTVPTAIKTRWNDAIRFVMNSTDAEFAAGIGNYFDVQSLIDYYLFGLVSCNLDGFGKNQLYMTYDGQKWYACVYDLDSTWGLWWTGASFVPADYERTDYQDFKDGEGNLLYIRIAQLFGDEIEERWNELKQSALSVDNIINRFERFTDIAPPYLVAEDYAATTANGAFTGIPSQNTNNIQQIRKYIVERLLWCNDFIVPGDYTAVPFVESNGTQYIDTGISGGTNAEYELKMVLPNIRTEKWYHYFAGASGTTVPKVLYQKNGGSIIAETEGTHVFFAPNNEYTVGSMFAIKYTNLGELYCNGVLKHTSTAGAGWGSLPWWIFNSPAETDMMSTVRLYSLKMWTDGELVRDFIPVIRDKDGIACLYDAVSKQFFESCTETPLVAADVNKSEYRPTDAMPNGYEEIVIDETSSIAIPGFTNYPSGVYGGTLAEIILPSTDVIMPPEFIKVTSIDNPEKRGSVFIYHTAEWEGNYYLVMSLPTSVVGSTVSEIKNWLAEHNIVFYVKSA